MAATPPVCAFGQPAPAFDLIGTDSKRYTLDIVRGENGLLVMFICNHCPYVKAVLDKLVRDARDLAAHGVGSVAICSNDAADYPEDSFDLVLMSHVIEHVHDPLATLAEIRRILRAGGTLVVTTPNAGSWGHRRFGSAFVHLDPPRHLQIFNGSNLAALIRRSGFRQCTVSSTLRITSFTFVISRLIRRSGHSNRPWPASFWAFAYGRAAVAAEMMIRVWDPLAADELLLEAHN